MKTVAAMIALLLLAPLAGAQDVARMDRIVQLYAPERFMGAVLVARGSDVLLSKAYGFANVEWDTPNTPTTKFRLGSLTKQFTAASILLLEERGKLKIDDRVKTYLPEAPAAWEAITIFHLLTHTSGIPNFTSFPDYATMERFPTPVVKIVERFRDKPLDFPPGEKMSYSNSGYIVLGQIIEKLSGGTYEQFVRDNLFTPIGMKDSGYDSNTAVIAHRASGYSFGQQGLANAGFVHMSVPHAAGALYSTTEDLLRWNMALYGGKVLSPPSLQKMTTPFKNDYAFGLNVRTVNGVKEISHAGGIQGFNTWLSYYPDGRLSVVVLSNLNGPAANEIGGKLATLARGGTVAMVEPPKEVQLSPAAMAQYVGTYEVQTGQDIMITLDGDHLSAQLTGLWKARMYAESDAMFSFKAIEARLEFDRQKRPAAYLILYRNGQELMCLRK